MIGVTNTQCPEYCPHGPEGAGPLTHAESRSQFAAWAVVSSPMVLGLDLRDKPTVDAVWDVITAREILAVSQTWAGDNGGLLAEAADSVTLPYCGWDQKPCQQPSWQVWKKAQPNKTAAVAMLNIAERPQSLTVSFAALGADLGARDTTATLRCSVRDLWRRAEVGTFTGVWTAADVPSHDTATVLIHSCTPSA